MTKEEALMTIQAIPESFWEKLSDTENEAVEMAVNSLKGQKWIPCSERLPTEADEDSDVWFPTLYVTTKFGKLRTGFYRTDRKEWYLYDEYDEEWIMANNNDVVAWMPLPEPYKGE